MPKIAVYGTLRKGQGRHHYFLQDSKFLYETKIPATMYHLGGFPCIKLYSENTIVAEVYEVSDDTLMRLDRLEGVGYGMYRRVPIHDGIFIYEWDRDVDGLPVIESGDWVNP